METRILLAGGGTAGHTSPLLAVSEALRGLAPSSFVFVGLVAGLVVLEPDLGTALVLVGVALIVYFAAGARQDPAQGDIDGGVHHLRSLAAATDKHHASLLR